MKRTEKTIGYIPLDSFEVYRVVDNMIYINCRGDIRRYDFQTKKDCERWIGERSTKNRINKHFEDYMACDHLGFFHFDKMHKVKRSMGIKQSKFPTFSEYVAYCEVNKIEVDYLISEKNGCYYLPKDENKWANLTEESKEKIFKYLRLLKRFNTKGEEISLEEKKWLLANCTLPTELVPGEAMGEYWL